MRRNIIQALPFALASAVVLMGATEGTSQVRFGVGQVPGVGSGPRISIGIGSGPSYPGRFDPYPGYWRQDGSGRYRPYGSDYWYQQRPGYYTGRPPYLYLETPNRYYPGSFQVAPTPVRPAAPAIAYGDFKVEFRVPQPDAKVTFNGVESGKKGLVRTFETADLQVGRTYRFEVVARWRKDGREVVVHRDVEAQAGEAKVMDLTPGK